MDPQPSEMWLILWRSGCATEHDVEELTSNERVGEVKSCFTGIQEDVKSFLKADLAIFVIILSQVMMNGWNNNNWAVT